MFRLLLKYKKGEEVKFLSHLEEIRTMERALRRSKLLLLYSQGFTPRPLLSFGPPLPVGFTSRAQQMEMRVSDKYTPLQVLSIVNPCLPVGFTLLEAEELKIDSPSLGSLPVKIEYLLKVEGKDVGTSISHFLSQPQHYMNRGSEKKGAYPFDVRPYVLTLEEKENKVIRAELLFTPQGSIKIRELEHALGIKILKGERVSLNIYDISKLSSL